MHTLTFVIPLAGLISMSLAQAEEASLNLVGRNVAASCANCHGTQGLARGGMAVLAGMPAERLLATLADYRSGARPATIMGQIAKGYSDAQLREVAAYYAALPRPR
jgi:cytochrome c553